ncbi:pre-mRNA-processing factor 6-like [Panicum miliaceum]|uniref:Pre-mRNA-processing factor 6-like n=1 Tax=Panicum miliaceum TaxID=4540 RepID=A0A3L6R5I9_PANMI|nr:pre-mRNA-processing factor 6-like [Panicum miliaceum]
MGEEEEREKSQAWPSCCSLIYSRIHLPPGPSICEKPRSSRAHRTEPRLFRHRLTDPAPAPARPARYDFLNSKPPPNYVAGLGRGATSFTTRSDIEPARAAPDLPDRSAAAPAAGRGRGKVPGEDGGGDEEKGYDENQKFDELEGNDSGLFSNAEADDDDREARRKVDKATNWLNRAVTLAPDIGDFWALYYKFELQHGNADTQKDVLKRCVAAEPKHGEKWQAITKAVENSHLPVEALLKKAVVALDAEERANATGA